MSEGWARLSFYRPLTGLGCLQRNEWSLWALAPLPLCFRKGGPFIIASRSLAGVLANQHRPPVKDNNFWIHAVAPKPNLLLHRLSLEPHSYP